MSLRIITGSAAIGRNPVPANLARSVQHACAGLRFHSLTPLTDEPVSVAEPYKPNNKSLLAEAERAQAAISELYAFREKIADLRKLFESLQVESKDLPAAIAEIEQILQQQLSPKIITLFDPLKPDLLLRQAWEELNNLEIAAPQPVEAVKHALKILGNMEGTIGTMISRNEKLLRNAIIARENVSSEKSKPDISRLLELYGGEA